MLNFFDLFKSSNRMSFYQLYNKLRKWNDSRLYPNSYELPDEMTFPTDFWHEVIKLYNLTRQDEFERAIAVFWADGELILSSTIKGNRRSVTPRSGVEVKYSHSIHKGYFTKEVFLDGKKYSSREVYHKNAPSKIEVKYLFNMHTHPPHEMTDGSKYYSFFSAQDIRSLLISKVIITGMIGNKLWLLVRTSRTPSVLDSSINDPKINMEFLYKELHIEIYSGEFNSILYRYKPEDQNS